ncbi:methyltransferase domain-containing protein [Curvibacter sp. HBC28]|jgi:predicted SAM-dependent methyltransferase|uniref:Methyltransferase domain-containing protein n=1 Tax=Curvibacter microcysteis TaxID=3026419 RepID=A0ABT5MII2_9BURK|nr:methyltransferase domain-containing protein [Curvibacter sp. HBC28]MDD0815699.1 methyltransferase domain-containing protein [Curvibacter sp. HBC28]
MKRINVGCGMTPTVGYVNVDNSFSIKLSKFPWLVTLLYRFKLVSRAQMDYIEFCQKNQLAWADVTRHIPVESGGADVLYSSHMLEHLDRQEARLFLAEAQRVLASGGVLRLALPDLEKNIRTYQQNMDADQLIDAVFTCVPRPRTLAQRIRMLLVGTRHHQWMYDGSSLCKLLSAAGFSNPVVLAAGQTTIQNPGPLNLREYEDISVYVEANRP